MILMWIFYEIIMNIFWITTEKREALKKMNALNLLMLPSIYLYIKLDIIYCI